MNLGRFIPEVKDFGVFSPKFYKTCQPLRRQCMLLRYACGLGLMLALVLPLIAQQQENATAKAREEFISLKVENRPFSDILDHVQEITRLFS